MTDALLWNEIGVIYQKMGLLDESIQAYLKAIKLDPDSSQFFCNLAYCYFQKKEYGRAISLYRKSIPLLKIRQDQVTAWNRIGDAYRALKDLENAFAAYRKADELEMQLSSLTTDPMSIQKTIEKREEKPSHLNNDLVHTTFESVKTAEEIPTRSMEQPLYQPEPDESLPKPQTIPIAASVFKAESAMVDTLADTAPTPSKIGACSAGNIIKAEKETLAPQKEDPSLEEVLAKVNVYEKVTQANPSNHRAWDTLGKLYKSLGRYQDAINAYQHAIESAPQNEHYLYYLGLLFAVEQQQENAIWALENVLCINPAYTLAHSALAGIYRRLGIEAKANQHISAALPDMNNESAYNRACFYAICGDVELSIEFLRLALQNNDTSIEWTKMDPDLEVIRNDERYQQLIMQLEGLHHPPTGGNLFSSELKDANNHLLPVLNYSVAR
jgi:tetratricopeptide (TPR) repeat protein